MDLDLSPTSETQCVEVSSGKTLTPVRVIAAPHFTGES